MRKFSISCLLIIAAAVEPPGMRAAAAQIPEWSCSGYYKNFSIILDPASASSGGLLGAVNNRLRVSITAEYSRRLMMKIAYGLIPRLKDSRLDANLSFASGIDPGIYRVRDLDRRLYAGGGSSNFDVLQNLDRAFLTIKTKTADFSIGRQALSWGSSRMINPTDLIAPFAFDELDSEDRAGVDALRMRAPVGNLGEFDAGYIAGRDANYKSSGFYTGIRFNAFKTDASLMFLGFKKNLMVGINLARSIGGAGTWMETAYVSTGILAKDNNNRGENYLRLSTGIDYNFFKGIYCIFEYHFNGAGGRGADEYSKVLAKTAYTDGSDYLLGRHYAACSAAYRATPLMTADTRVLWNLNDYSLLLSPRIEYNIAENIYVEAGAFAGTGPSPLSVPAPPVLPFKPRSEFGSYPDVYYTSIRVYF